MCSSAARFTVYLALFKEARASRWGHDPEHIDHLNNYFDADADASMANMDDDHDYLWNDPNYGVSANFDSGDEMQQAFASLESEDSRIASFFDGAEQVSCPSTSSCPPSQHLELNKSLSAVICDSAEQDTVDVPILQSDLAGGSSGTVFIDSTVEKRNGKYAASAFWLALQDSRVKKRNLILAKTWREYR